MHLKLVLVAALAQQCSQYVVFSLFCYTVLGFTSYLSTFGFSFAFSWKSDSIFGGLVCFPLAYLQHTWSLRCSSHPIQAQSCVRLIFCLSITWHWVDVCAATLTFPPPCILHIQVFWLISLFPLVAGHVQTPFTRKTMGNLQFQDSAKFHPSR